MSTDEPQASEQQTTAQFLPLRIWPAIALLSIGAVCRILPSLIDGVHWVVMVFGPMLCGVLLLVWWLAASRATGKEKIVGFVGVIAILIGTVLLLHDSMLGPKRTPFAPGFMLVTLQLGLAAFAIAAIVFSRMLSFRRTVLIVLATLCGFGCTTLVRNEGMRGNGAQEFSWRWQPTKEEQLVALKKSEKPNQEQTMVGELLEEDLANPAWPAFRGPNRDGVQRGSLVLADWESNPPELLWKTEVGPGWSSFAVAGNLLFTQEQLGTKELVVCYSAEDGKQIWVHEDESRFEEAMGGPGPRATPTIADGALFTTGATGHLTRLDLLTGKVVWQQDLREMADREPPMWGFSASPLIVNRVVIVHAGGKDDKGTLAFDVETGELRWGTPAGDHSYCSPQSATLADQEVVLMLTNKGLHVLDPNEGSIVLDYEWTTEEYRAVQPKLLADDHLLIPTGMGYGTRRIQVTSEEGEFGAKDIWTSRNLKVDYNDFVLYKGYAYGFDGNIFTCVNLEDGSRSWKRGRYGNGQALLLEDCGLLLVISEQGELVLLEANPEKHVELAKIPALEGKTWNHPVLIGDRLYIRNAQEAACYRLPLQDSGEQQTTPLAMQGQ